jgi:replicative DNA helicase
VGHDAAEKRAIDWEPIGTGGKARLIVVGVDSGAVHDIEVVDLSRWHERSRYAHRLIQNHVVPWDEAEVSRELLRIAVERCNALPEPEVPLPTLATAFDEWERHETVPCVCTGFQPLDALAGGELPGGLPLGTITILLGPPAAGKSALALQVCVGALLGNPELPAVWALGEMSLTAFFSRSIAVGSVLLGTGSPVTKSAADRRRAQAKDVADELRRRIGERLTILPPTLTPDRIEQAVVASGAKLCVIDYLQLIRLPNAADARTEVDSIMARLRAMSLEHGCAILLISNIAKGIDGSSRIGSLGKNSSQIDFDADIVLLGEADEGTDENGLRPVRWLCKKHRHGQARDLLTLFDGDLQVFTDAETIEPFEEFADFAPKGAAR